MFIFFISPRYTSMVCNLASLSKKQVTKMVTAKIHNTLNIKQ